MLTRKYYGPRATFVPPPPSGSGYFNASGTGNNLTVYNIGNGAVALSIGTLANTVGASTQVAAGNSVNGLYVRNGAVGGTSTYTYASNVANTGGNLTASIVSSQGMAVSNDVQAIIGIGGSSGNRVTNKYTFASNTVGLATLLTSNITRSAADGNLTRGIIFLNNGTNQTNRYIYASDTCSLGGTLPFNHTGGIDNSISSSTEMVGSNTAGVTHRYNYAADTAANSTSLLSGGNGAKGASDGTKGVFLMCSNTPTTNVWTFAGSTVAAGSSLTAPANNHCPGVSSYNPGCNV